VNKSVRSASLLEFCLAQYARAMAVVGQQSLGYTLMVDVELGLSCRLGFWSWAYHSERNVCLVWEGFAARMEAK
jgi:hypothetical protein